MTKPIVVQKYGGSSLKDIASIKRVAQLVQACQQAGNRVCVVVSAMGNTTNELIALAHEVCENPTHREMDLLLSCGERVSMPPGFPRSPFSFEVNIFNKAVTADQNIFFADANHAAIISHADF